MHGPTHLEKTEREKMRGSEVARIRDKLLASRAALLAAVEGLDDREWEWRPNQERWSVRQTLAHVGSAERSHLQVARAFVSGEAIAIAGFDNTRKSIT